MKNEKEFLDFVYVGAPRAGSNWLAATLNEHPDVWIPHNKELHFFNDRLLFPFEYKYPKGIEFYNSYFKDAPDNVKLGELSPFYYFDPNVAYRIYRFFPHVRIIIMLRNPVDVMYSMYLLLRNREPRENTFEKEIIKHPQFIDLGFFHRLLTPYFDWFPRENIFLRIYESFFSDEVHGCEELFSFLEIDPKFKSSFLGKKVNVSRSDKPRIKPYFRSYMIRLFNMTPFVPFNNILHKLKINKLKMDFKGIDKKEDDKRPKATINIETRKMLLEQFEPDISRLEILLGDNLDVWRQT